MSSSPFSARPVPEDVERRRSRLVVLIAMVGIAATLLAYAASPGVRHAVGHAAHSVRHAVVNAVDHDGANKAAGRAASKHAPAQPSTHVRTRSTPSPATTR